MWRLGKKGYLIALLSNRSSSESDELAENSMQKTVELLKKQGINVHYYDFAKKTDFFKKPDLGMVTMLASKLKELGPKVEIQWELSFVVGNNGYQKNLDTWPNKAVPGTDHSNFDRMLAESLEIDFVHAKVFRGEVEKRNIRGYSPISLKNFYAQVVNAIVQNSNQSKTFESFDKDELVKSLLKVKSISEDIKNNGVSFGSKEAGYHLYKAPSKVMRGDLGKKLPYLHCYSRGDNEHSVDFFIYWDGLNLRAYIPNKGNTWNRKNRRAYETKAPGVDDRIDILRRGLEVPNIKRGIKLNAGVSVNNSCSHDDIKRLANNKKYHLPPTRIYDRNKMLLEFKKTIAE